jgi:inhibitor of cysteine peptidase
MEEKALPILTIDETSNGQTLHPALGQTVEICLEENPTTGYRWRMAQTGGGVDSLLHDAFEPGRQSPGQPGIHRWQFKVVAAGRGPVRFVYRRSWEDDSAAARVFTVTLSVKE